MEQTDSTWSDERLDEIAGRVDHLSDRVDAGFARLDGRIDTLNHTMVQGMIALISIITVLLSVLVGIVATHP